MPRPTHTVMPWALRALALAAASALLFVLFPSLALNKEAPRETSPVSPAGPDARASLQEAYGKLPMSFEANEGQAGNEVRFLARGQGYSLFLSPAEAVLDLHKPGTRNRGGVARAQAEATNELPETERNEGQHALLRMQLRGAATKPRVAGVERQPGRVNYFMGNVPGKWRTNIPTYAKVRYEEVYKGIDLLYYGNQQQLEYDFITAPGADPGAIRLGFEGGDGLELNERGELVLKSAGGEVSLHRPIAYQEVNGERREVASSYALGNGSEVGFSVGEYDHSKPLVIDPVLVYSTYLGGSDYDLGMGIAVDSGGNAYVTGQTSSANFSLVNPAQGTKNGYTDAFITKLNASGSAVIYSTYLGGSNYDSSNSIAVDAAGNAYITGITSSDNFPMANPLHSSFAGSYDAFVAELNATGSALLYSTYLGGNSFDSGLDIAVDDSGHVYVAGEADSRDLPVQNALQPTKAGNVFFKSGDAAAGWSVSDAGLLAAAVYQVLVDPANTNTIYVAGDNGVFKSTNGGQSWSAAGQSQLSTTVLRLVFDPTNTNIIYAATYNGIYKTTDAGAHWTQSSNGLLDTFLQVVAIDPAAPSTVYTATGYDGLFKSTDGAANWSRIDTNYLNVFQSVSNFYALLVDPTKSTTIYAATDRGFYKSINGGINWTSSPAGLPYAQPLQTLTLDPTNPATLYATSYNAILKSVDNGANWTNISSVPAQVTTLAISPSDSSTIYVGTRLGGVFKSTDGGINWTALNSGLTNPYVNALAINPANPSTIYVGNLGGAGAFVAKLYPAGSSQVYVTYLGGDGSQVANSITADASGNAYVTGSTTATNFPTVNAAQPTKGDTFSNDAFVSKLNPSGSALVFSTFLGGSGSDSGRGIALDGSGNVYVAGSTTSSNFPIMGPFQAVKADQFGTDAFVTKLTAAGNALSYSTYLGGNGEDIAFGISVDQAGNAYVTGSTTSSNFPLVSAYQSARLGYSSRDAFVTKVMAAGSILGFSTYLGGIYDEAGRGVALDSTGSVYVAGYTYSPDFPLINPSQQSYGGNSDAFIAKFNSAPDLLLTMTGSPDPVLYGGDLTYNISISNNGELPATNVTLNDALPSGTSIISLTASQGSCTNTRNLKCSLGTINPNATVTVTLVVSPPQVKTLKNTASVTAAEPESSTANNSATVSTQVSYTDLMVRNYSALQLTQAGGTDTFIVTVKNLGPSAASSLTITDELPAETTFASCTATQGGVCGGSGNSRTVTFAGLASGASATAAFGVTVNSNVPPGTLISDTASVTSLTPDINPTNDADTASTLTRATAATTGPKKNGAIAFDAGRGDGTSGTNDIFVVNPDGTGLTNLTSETSTYETQPAWSPDGTMIAYLAHGNNEDGIYVMNADGSNKRRVTSGPGSYYDQNPVWSPDGTRLAFGGNRGSGIYGVFVINLDGSGLTRLGDGNAPDWSPDGSRIIYSTGRGIGMMYSDGSGATIIPVPSPGNGSGFFKWSPDGSKIVLTGTDMTHGTSALFTLNPDGTNLVQINNTSGSGYPSWSPDGTKLVFAMLPPFGYGGSINTINLDGTGLTKVSGDLSEVVYASWQPQPSSGTPLPATYNISGRMTNTAGNVGVYGNVLVTGTVSRTATTDYQGNYIIRGLPAGGNYTLTPQAFGTSEALPATRVYNNLSGNQTNADFSITFPIVDISGYVKDLNGAPLVNVSVSSGGGYPEGVTLTDASGFFKFGNVQAGRTYYIRAYSDSPQYANYVFDPPQQILQSIKGSQTLNFVARPKTALISGQIIVGNVAKSGVTVYLAGLQSATAITDQNGNYAFANLGEGGSFTVTPDPSFYPFAPASRTINNLSGQMSGVNFAAPLNQYLISGTLNDRNNSPIADATVTVSGATNATAQTDAQGFYSFLLPANGTYTLKASKQGYTFAPPSVTFNNLSSNGKAFFTGSLTYVQFAQSALSVGESDKSVSVTVQRYGSFEGTAKVDYSTSDGTASQRTDYTGISGTLVFAPNESSKTLIVPIIDDAYVEGPETINLTLSNPVGATIGTPGAVVLTIINDDTAKPSINPVDNAQFFVRQHYQDFLNRVPDQGGLDYWTEQITDCGKDQDCINSRRVGVSAAYFIETEFQDTGGFVYRFYKASYGARPTYAQFMPDRSRVVGGVDLESGKLAFADAWVQRPEFLAKYPAGLTGAQFIDALLQTVQQGSGVDLSGQRAALNNDYAANQSRARILRLVADNPAFKEAEYNKAFVLMQYFGYLRRDPEEGGYLFWLDVLNNKVPGNYRGMVCAFITSAEYQDRFSSFRTRDDRICSTLK